MIASSRNRASRSDARVDFTILALLSVAGFTLGATVTNPTIPISQGRVVATGIPGASGISAVGIFHAGGPIHDNPTFREFTLPGRVLDPDRVLVTSLSTFGSPDSISNLAQGSVLSIDPRGDETIQVPSRFSASGGQSVASSGRVILFTASTGNFLNAVYNKRAVTADFPAVSAPSDISINNAFGRVWITSEPHGLGNPGFQSVNDPDGRPLNHAPNASAGGVFASDYTNRFPQLVAGTMRTGAIATALLGKSPDGSGRAVFAQVNADGSLCQVHVGEGMDGLMPPGTIRSLVPAKQIRRTGMVFNWVPDPRLFIADPLRNAILVLSLRADGKIFRVESSGWIRNRVFDHPVALAPVVAEIENPGFASNTTLAGGSDIFVANQGNGTVVRITQDGKIVAVRKLALKGRTSLGNARINGIAISRNADRFWVTTSETQLAKGAVLEFVSFGSGSE